MEDIELKQMWASLYEKQDTNLIINKKNLENTTNLSVMSLLNSMKPTKIIAIIVGILWVFFLDTIIINTFGVATWFFTVSASIQSVITKLAIGIYLYQLITIQQVDNSQSVVITQQKLSELKISTLWVTRILFLQLPVWSTFYLNPSLFKADNLYWLVFQGIVTLLLIYGAIWLFININPKNKDKRWFKLLFEGKEWNPIIKSMELIDDLKEFEKL
jgi:hypothetical protein